MKTPFFFRLPAKGRDEWWTYIVTFALVVSGMMGFGNIPLLLVMSSKGYSSGQMERTSLQEYALVLGNNVFFTVSLFPMVVAFGMLLIAFKFVHRRPVLSYFTNRTAFDLNRFFTGFSVTAAMFALLFFIGYSQGHENLVWNFDAAKFGMLLLICLFIVPLQTGVEELFFRGYLLQLSGRATSRGLIVIIVNGILFGLLHIMNPENTELGGFAMVFYVMSGIFAALITLMDDGIELSWGFHTANNFMGMLIVTNNWQVIQTDALFIDTSAPAVGWDMYITLFVWYPLLTFLFAKLFRWSEWKKRLLGK